MSSGLRTVALGLASAAAFGAADFSGGFASKRANVFGVLTVARLAGLALMVALGRIAGEPLPSGRAVAWSMAAGAVGGLALAAFYRALAIGKMGIAAPITSVLSAALPLTVGALTEGLPRKIQVAGLLLALVGLWFISRPEEDAGRPEGLGLALLAGTGFGCFLVLIHRAGTEGAYWPMAVVLLTSCAVSGTIVALEGSPFPGAQALPLSLAAGLLDTLGDVSFLFASRHAELGEAAVLSSLYPAVTVLLARWALRERMSGPQTAGILMALVAILLIAAG